MKAVIVVDAQNRFRGCASKAILQNIKDIVLKARKERWPVVFTQHHDPDQQTVLAQWWNEPIEKNSKSWQLMEDLRSLVDEETDLVVQDKVTYDAFLGTGLEEFLKKHNVREVIVCGFMTNLCCETTARSAFCRNFNVLFPDDANGTISDEMHERSLKNLEYGFAKIVKTSDIIK